MIICARCGTGDKAPAKAVHPVGGNQCGCLHAAAIIADQRDAVILRNRLIDQPGMQGDAGAQGNSILQQTQHISAADTGILMCQWQAR